MFSTKAWPIGLNHVRNSSGLKNACLTSPQPGDETTISASSPKKISVLAVDTQTFRWAAGSISPPRWGRSLPWPITTRY